MYRLNNQTGLRVSYWARSGAGAGRQFSLDPWEEAPLAVTPARSAVVLPHTQQQAQPLTSPFCFYSMYESVFSYCAEVEHDIHALSIWQACACYELKVCIRIGYRALARLAVVHHGRGALRHKISLERHEDNQECGQLVSLHRAWFFSTF